MDQLDGETNHNEQNIRCQVHQEITRAQFWFVLRTFSLQAAVIRQACQEHECGNPYEGRSDRAEAPKTVGIEKVECAAHGEADGEDSRESMARALPSAAEQADEQTGW